MEDGKQYLKTASTPERYIVVNRQANGLEFAHDPSEGAFQVCTLEAGQMLHEILARDSFCRTFYQAPGKPVSILARPEQLNGVDFLERLEPYAQEYTTCQ